MKRVLAALAGAACFTLSAFVHADVRVVLEEGIVDQSSFERALRVEGVERGTIKLSRKGDLVEVVVDDSEPRTRALSLADVPVEHHARVLALAASELLRSMPIAKAEAPSEPTPPRATGAGAAKAPAQAASPEPMGIHVEGQVGAFLRAYPSSTVAFGPAGKLSLCMSIVCPYAGLLVGLSSSQTNLGNLTTTLFRGGVGIDLAFRPRPWLMLTTGPSAYVGSFGVSAVPSAGATPNGFSAPSFDAKWSMLAAVRAGYFVWLFAEASPGVTAFGGTALVANEERASDRGGFFEASIGLRFADDREK
ncbi:MAG: hypothetical protein U0174_09755 [Polyangiaceae bacterium]